MICVTCKAELPGGAKFCHVCGKEQPPPEPAKIKPLPVIMTMKEAAEFLRISRTQIYRLTLSKQIPFTQVGAHKRFITEDIITWLRSTAG